MPPLTMVVQWSAHLTWYPKPLPALPKTLKLSLDGREVVGSNPTHGVYFLLCPNASVVIAKYRSGFLFLCHIFVHLHVLLTQLRSSNTKHAYPSLAYELSTSIGIHGHELAKTTAKKCRRDSLCESQHSAAKSTFRGWEVQLTSTEPSPVLRTIQRDHPIYAYSNTV
jgi:hypothetical protein